MTLVASAECVTVKRRTEASFGIGFDDYAAKIRNRPVKFIEFFCHHSATRASSGSKVSRPPNIFGALRSNRRTELNTPRTKRLSNMSQL